jgi:hypothetical protein
MVYQINPQSVIPDYWHGIYATNDRELVFYGSNLLSSLIKYWRGVERTCVGEVKRLQEQIDLLTNQTVSSLRQEAAQYENPVFGEIGVISAELWRNDPEPLDELSKNRDRGATTFNVCGWCKYVSGGPVRYGYFIKPTCDLIPREYGDGSGYGGSEEFRFDTPCALTNGSDALIKTSVKHLEVKREDAKSRKSSASEKIRYLLNLVKDAEEKPFLSGHRPSDWFNIGDEVMCFVDFEDATRKGFIPAKVVSGYRHHDGCVSVVTDKRVHDNTENHDGCGLGLGTGRPEILHKWEYEYLQSHPDFFEVWLREASRAAGFNPTVFEQLILN